MAGRSLNKVMLIGNLTRDPEIRMTAKSSAVAKMGLATNRSWVNPDSGERQEQVEFHNLTAWGKLAETCEKYLHKGDRAYFEGRLQTSEYTGKDGTQKRSTEIVVETMILLGGRGGAAVSDDAAGDSSFSSSAPSSTKSAAPRSRKKAADPAEAAPSDDVSAVEDISDDIPF